MKTPLRIMFRALFIAAAVAAVSCVNFNNVHIESVKIGSVKMSGLKSLSGTFTLTIENNSKEFTLSDIEAVVKQNGKEIGSLKTDDFTVEGKTTSTNNVAAYFYLSDTFSVIQAMTMLGDLDIDDFTFDLSVKVKPKGGSAQKVSRNNIPARQLISSIKF